MRWRQVVGGVALVLVAAQLLWLFSSSSSSSSTFRGGGGTSPPALSQQQHAPGAPTNAQEQSWVEQVVNQLQMRLPRDGFLSLSSSGEAPCIFSVSSRRAPVFEDAKKIDYANHPLSPLRPQGQYPPPVDAKQPPVVAIITATHNPKDTLLRTHHFMVSQSLQQFQWIVVNDHSSEVAILNELRDRTANDPRIQIVDNTGARGLPSARNFGFRYVVAPFLASLDDDDLFELTALEKTVWFLESNPQMAMCGFYTIGFGSKNYTWTHGFHDGLANVNDNKLIVSTLVRVSVLRSSTLGGPHELYDTSMVGGMEDWDLWLRLASLGHWGFTLPENLFWYTVRSDETRKKLWPSLFEKKQEVKQSMRQKYGLLLEHGMPNVSIAEMKPFEHVPSDPPFTNRLVPACKRIMLIVSMLGTREIDHFHMRLIRALAADGWLVTVVCTLYNPPTSTASRPFIMQYTHDVFVLPTFLRAVDFPRFIVYLAQSRGVQKIALGDTQLGYELLPYLSRALPEAVFVDFVHNEASWKNGGFLRYSVINARYLSNTFATSQYLKDSLVAKGRLENSVHVAYVGANIVATTRRDGDKYTARARLDLPYEAVVILVTTHSSDDKTVWVVTDAISETQQAVGRRPMQVVVLGDGPQQISMEARVKQLRLSDMFRFVTHTLEDEVVLEYMRAADVFFLPSLSAGISVRLFQAMALSLAVVATDVSGLSEVVTEGCGYLIHPSQRRDDAVMKYASKLTLLVINQQLRLTISANARKRIENHFSSDKLLKRTVDLIGQTTKNTIDGTKQHPAIYYALDNALRETKDYSDLKMIELRRRLPPRDGFGAQVQGLCGEYSADMTRWIDGLLTGSCDARFKAEDAQPLHDAAMYQCGQWCIFDVHQKLPGSHDEPPNEQRKPYAGWVFNGSCFNRFTSSHYCQLQFGHLRPAT